MDLEPYLLEHALSGPRFKALRKICTHMWDPHVKQSAPPRAFDDVIFRRHDNTIRYAVPWVAKHIALPSTHIVDFGCGCGSSSVAFSYFAKQVTGLEIDPSYVGACRRRVRLLGVQNAECVEIAADRALEALEGAIRPDSSVLFLAVIEHLTEREQVEYLRKAWSLIQPGQIIAIVETPNLLSLYDDHTFEASFAHLVSDEIFLDWLRLMPAHTRFRELLTQLGDTASREEFLLKRRRLGVGVAPQVFEVALQEPLDEILVADGFDQMMVSWFPPNKGDELLVQYWRHYQPPFPIGFARSVLSLIFKKPLTADERLRNRERNIRHAESIYRAQSSSEIDKLAQRNHHNALSSLKGLAMRLLKCQ